MQPLDGAKVDLTSCDDEPIHAIGAIQPGGALIAADAATGVVLYASDNVGEFLKRSAKHLLGRQLSDVLGSKAAAELLGGSHAPVVPDILRPCLVDIEGPDAAPIPLECYPHHQGGLLVLEFVTRSATPAALWEQDLVRQRIVSNLIRPETLPELARAGADIVREVTGFDRVMIYRFAPDKHGEVIGESNDRPDTFMGLHYPASDIPDPARRHFALNVLRVIPDIHAAPVPIFGLGGGVADAASGNALDLTFSKLRAVAPVHIEYLRNMGVEASLSISLIANGELWGLVACHHYAPLHLSWSSLRFVELVGGIISALLQSLENTVQLRHSIRAEKLAFDIERRARLGESLPALVASSAEALLGELSADGIVLRIGGRDIAIGNVPMGLPGEDELKRQLIDGIAACEALASPAMDPQTSELFAGAAMMELSGDGEDFLVLYRREYEHSIHWAGKPEKREIVLPGGGVRLSPRGSFGLWREERRGRSKPFTAIDLEVLRIVRRALFAINSLERERAAVAARLEAESEEMRLRLVLLDAARSRSMGELASALAHELNQPLAAVTNYVNACRQELRRFEIAVPSEVGRLMDRAVVESSRAADLVRRLRGLIGRGEVVLELSSLAEVLKQGVDLALAPRTEPDAEVIFDIDRDIPNIWIDPVQVAQVILNLARNSLAAMRTSRHRRLTIAARLSFEHVEVSVTDTGSGIAPSVQKSLFEPFHDSTTRGMGIGLSLCRSIVEAHGGRIWTRPMDEGTQFVFTLEARQQRDD